MRALLRAGYGVVLQGVYAEVPRTFALQRDFGGPHAIYVDGYYAPPGGGADAFYVLDPLFHPWTRYEGAWWPGGVVDRFAAALGRNGRYLAAWAFPFDGSVPPTEEPDLDSLPSAPPPGQEQPEVAPEGPESGDVEPEDPVPDGLDGGGQGSQGEIPSDPGGTRPGTSVCLIAPIPRLCPTGLPGVVGSAPVTDVAVDVPRGPPVKVDWVDTAVPGRALIRFVTSPTAAASLAYWRVDGMEIRRAVVPSLPGDPAVRIADLQVLGAARYAYRITAIDGRLTSLSGVGGFTTPPGLSDFRVVLESRDSPPSPAVLPGFGPLVELAGDAPIGIGPGDCEIARVRYGVAGIDHSEVAVRAYRVTTRPLAPEAISQTTLQAIGPPGQGELVLGCFGAGSYRVAIDLLGDATGDLYTVLIAADR
jgi:hypothetical protein